MAKQTATWRLGLHVGFEPFKPQTRLTNDRPSWDLTITPVIVGDHESLYESVSNPDRVTNPHDRTDYKGLYLKDLQVHTYASTEADGIRRMWGHTFCYRNIFAIDTVREAERIAKTLRTIDRRMESLKEAEGYAPDFVSFVRYFAKAIKADCFVFATQRGGWSYSETPCSIVPIGEGIDRLRSICARFVNVNESERKEA